FAFLPYTTLFRSFICFHHIRNVSWYGRRFFGRCTYKYYGGVGWTPIGSYGWNDGCYAWSHDCIGLSRSNGKNNVFFIPCYNVDPYIYDSKRSKWKDYCILS